jgi:N6-adenosine-specific RNA methylase IME4
MVEQHLIETIDIGLLKPHPLNAVIYVDDEIEPLDEVRFERLIVSEDYMVVCGHRRYYAALNDGRTTIEVERRCFDSEADILRKLLSDNLGRDKTNEQKIREGMAWEGLFDGRVGGDRQSEEGKKAVHNYLGTGSVGETVDLVAEKLGKSGEWYRQGRVCVLFMDTYAGLERAVVVKMTLKDESVKAAFKLVQKFEQEAERKKASEERERQKREAYLASLKAKDVLLPVGKYSCLVVDPPWEMQKILRDVRPNQVAMDYPTMSLEDLVQFPVPDMAAGNSHLYLWTTHKHLPDALYLAEQWGFHYQCLLTWVKNIGFTPFSWMYSTEHVLFCTKGDLPLLDIGRRVDFVGKVREHSRKPDEFYQLVLDVSPGPRVDVFARENHVGFTAWGNEVTKYDAMAE